MTTTPTPAEIEAHIRGVIRYWVWSGYHDATAVEDMLPDLLEDGVDADAMFAVIPVEFASKALAEKDWPRVTDCDRIDAAFVALDASGVCAVQYAGYTMSDGLSDVREAAHDRGVERYQGYCFFHAQDVEHALDGHGMHIAFGAFERTGATSMQIAERVVKALSDAGLVVEWGGDEAKRIAIPVIEWRRRL